MITPKNEIQGEKIKSNETRTEHYLIILNVFSKFLGFKFPLDSFARFKNSVTNFSSPQNQKYFKEISIDLEDTTNFADRFSKF